MDNSMSRIGASSIEKSALYSKTKQAAGSDDTPSAPQDTFLASSHTEDSGMSKFNYFPQDALMDKQPNVEQIEKSKIGNSLEGPRVNARDEKFPLASSDRDGNYLYTPDKPQFDQVSSFVTATKTLDMHEKNIGHKIDWAFGSDQIKVNAHAAEGVNAFYSRWQESVSFYYFDSKPLGKTIQTSQSPDIVSHETGHATLDGLKPGFLGGWGGEGKAIHEAFADCSAMLYTLTNDKNLESLAYETTGDLSKGNRLSRLAEEFGWAAHLQDKDPSDDDQVYLRDGNNDFKYKPIDEMPDEGPKDQITSEPHSFGRILAGAFYHSIKNVFDKNLTEMGPPEFTSKQEMISAFRTTGNKMGPVIGKAMDLTPSSGATFKTIGLSMLKADQMLNGGKHKQQIADAFIKHEILTPDEIKKSDAELSDLSAIKLDRPMDIRNDAMEFLDSNREKLGVAPGEFKKAKIVKDTYGNTIIQYSGTKEVPVSFNAGGDAMGRGDISTDVEGGMTIAFDKDGNLVSKTDDRVNEGKINQTIKGIEDAVDKKLIKDQTTVRTHGLFESPNKPYEGELVQDSSGKIKLVKIPVIVN